MRGRGAVGAVLLCAATASAHPLGFGSLTLTGDGDEVRFTLSVSGTEQRGSDVALDPPPGCARVAADARGVEGEALLLRGRWRCPGGIAGRAITLRGLEGSGVQVVARATLPDGTAREGLFDDERRTLTLPRRGGLSAARYVALGARHVIEGTDHLALLLCLALWVRGARALLVSVSGFTLGHSVTLALASLGALALPARPVEACIALSVLLLAAELARGRPPPRSHGLFSAAVGLLHGLGFAGALRDVGLPRGARAASLVAFNAGVELGQLGFLAGVFAVGWVVRRTCGALPGARRLLIEAAGAWSAMLLWQRVVG